MLLDQRFITRLFFAEAAPCIRKGLQHPLQATDLPEAMGEFHPGTAPSLGDFSGVTFGSFFGWYLRVHWKKLLLGCLFAVLLSFEGVGPAWVVKSLLVQLETTGRASFSLGFVFFALVATLAIVLQHFIFSFVRSSASVTNTLSKAIFRKSLKLSGASRRSRSAGDVINLLGSDSNAVSELSFLVMESLRTFLSLVFAAVFIGYTLGWKSALSILIVLFLTPLVTRIARHYNGYDDRIADLRDARVSKLSHALGAMKVIKSFGWSGVIRKGIHGLRQREVETRLKSLVLECRSGVLFAALGFLLATLSLGIAVWTGVPLTAAKVFPLLALIASLSDALSAVPRLMSGWSRARISSARVSAFLKSSEIEQVFDFSDRATLRLEGAEVTGDQKQVLLSEVDLQILQGQHVAVVGQVGSGKSTLLLALLGEMDVSKGRIYRPEQGVVWLGQEPFLINGTLKENITFGNSRVTDEDCWWALEEAQFGWDLRSFPQGLSTVVGEQGLNLSGGQKARLALARAVAQKPQIVLLDDVLAAVDPATEKALIEGLMRSTWRNTTLVLATHRLDHLLGFDHCVVLRAGRVVSQGKPTELKDTCSVLGSLLSQCDEGQLARVGIGNHLRAAAQSSEVGSLSEKPFVQSPEEDRSVGSVDRSLYLRYFTLLGGKAKIWGAAGLIGLSLMCALAPLLQSIWVSKITNQASSSPWTLLAGFVGLGLVAMALGAWEHWAWGRQGLAAASHLHGTALKALFRAPSRFFDENPQGRILNRFSNDVRALDEILPSSFEGTFRSLTMLFVACCLFVAVFPWVALALIPIGYVFYRVQHAYRICAREAKRLDSVAASPVFSFQKEGFEGACTVRSFGAQSLFVTKFDQYLLHKQRMSQGVVLLNRWFSLRVPLLSSCLSGLLIFCVIFAANQKLISSGTAGLILTYSLGFWASLNWCVRAFSEVESKMTAIERLETYASQPEEPEGSFLPGELWPGKGHIQIEDLTVQYAPHLPKVISDFWLSIPAGQKLALVGRTGSGKSSFVQSLLRMVEVPAGKISIDGIPWDSVPLDLLIPITFSS